MLLTTSILVIITLCFFIKASHINMRVISIPSFFITYYFFASYIGIVLMYYGLDSHASSYGVIDHNRVITLFILSSMAIITIGFTFLLLSRYTNNNWADFQSLDMPLTKLSQLIVNMTVVLCIIVTLLYLYALPEVPIFAALRGDFAKAIMLRTTLSTTNVVTILNAQFFSVVMKFILPFVLYVSIGQEMLSQNRITTLWTAFLFLFVLFSTIIETGKGGFVIVLLLTALTRGYVKRIKFNFKLIFISLFAFLSSSALMMIFFMGTKGNVWNFIGAVFSRLFTGNLVPAYHVLDLLDQRGDFYWGTTFPNPRGIFPFEQIILERAVWINITGNSGDSIYSAPFPYWAEMYANFGFTGVFIASVIVGGGLFFLQIFANSLPSNPVKIAFIIWSASYYSQLAVRGLTSFFFDYYFISILLFVFFVNYANKSKIKLSILGHI